MEAAGAIKQDDEISESDQIVNLTSEGINAGDVKELQDVGIYTCNDLMMHYNESPTGMKGLSKAMAEMIHESAENLLSQGFMSGSDLFSEESVVRITTENESLAIAPVSVVTDTTDTSKKVMLVAGAVAASSCGHGQSWGFLHREVLFDDAEGVDLDLFKPSPIPVGADFGINRLPLVTSSSLPGGVRHEMIPLVSVISIRRSLFHVSAHAIAGLVKCTDPEGSILIEVSQEQGTELLLVCRPGSGKARCLPAVPVSLGVNVSTSGTGIVSDHCGSKEDFIVVQLQTSSSQSPQVLNVLCFESKDSTWRVMEVRFEHCFTAHTVTSHSGGLVFLDPDHGMIRFDPCKNEPVTIIPFPGVENTEPTDPRHQYITSSEGRLCHIRIHGVPYEPKGVFGLAVAVKKAAMGYGL